MIKKSVKLGVELGLFVVIAIGVIYFFSSSDYASTDSLRGLVESSGWAGGVVFVACFILLVLLGISNTPLVIFSGVLFGYGLGFLFSFSALFISSIFAFYISSFISHEILKKYHPASGLKFHFLDSVIERMESSVEKDCFKTVFLSKFIISNVIVSYALGTMSEKVNRTSFFVASFFNNMILSFLWVFLGVSLLENLYYVLGLAVFIFGVYSFSVEASDICHHLK